MATTTLLAFNRGLVSRLGLARVDVKRLALSAETMTNWIPRVLGSMSLRPGWKYIGATRSNAAARFLKFIFGTTDTSLIELTDLTMRVWINDTLLARPAVTAAVTNGTFPTDLTGWTDSDEVGATSSWVAPNYMQLVGNGTARAIRDQQVTVTETGTEHALRVVVVRGPVYLRVGSTSGADDYVSETALGAGTHSISFTPTGNFWIRFFSSRVAATQVSQCTVEAAGTVEITTPWSAARLSSVRADQSGDTMFVACPEVQQRKIERRGTRPAARSWSVVLYQPNDGPFLVQNTTPTTLTPSALSGNITLTASQPTFKATHVGALFSATSVGQTVTTAASASSTATNSIRVTGIGSSRVFSVVISGDATGSTVDLQRSYDNSTWANVGGALTTWTADVTTTQDDALDNQIVYYRLILTTRVAPDTVTMTLRIGSGSIRGIARVTGFTSSTVVNAEVLSAMGGTTANSVWQEGSWSDKTGWPSAVRLHEGRLWWAGKNGVWGSASDAYDAFDETLIGDAGPINRSIGAGPVDTVNWILALQRMILGAQGAELSIRSSSLDETLTATNFHMKFASTQGSDAVEAVQVDQQGYYVNRSGFKVFELSFDIKAYDYLSQDAMALNPELGRPGIVRMDVQRQPDTRLHCVRSDGTVALMVVDKQEEVTAWVEIETDGEVEDVITLPAADGDLDDQVYYVVKRTINGSTVRYLEKWAQEIDCRGGALNKQADSFVSYSGAPTAVVTGLSHLEGEEVVVWADAADVGTDDSSTAWTQRYTVSGGQIVLTTPAADIVAGLAYEGPFKSSKLGTALTIKKNIESLGLLLADMHPKGLRFGPDFGRLDDMPSIEGGTEVGSATVSDYDREPIMFPSTWSTDTRLCLLAVAPRPCTVMAAIVDVT